MLFPKRVQRYSSAFEKTRPEAIEKEKKTSNRYCTFALLMGVLNILDHRRVRQGLTLVFLTATLLCIFPPEHPAFQWWSAQAPFVAIGFLLLALCAFFINRLRLMFVCLGCSAAISFYHTEVVRYASPPAENTLLEATQPVQTNETILDQSY